MTTDTEETRTHNAWEEDCVDSAVIRKYLKQHIQRDVVTKTLALKVARFTAKYDGAKRFMQERIQSEVTEYLQRIEAFARSSDPDAPWLTHFRLQKAADKYESHSLTLEFSYNAVDRWSYDQKPTRKFTSETVDIRAAHIAAPETVECSTVGLLESALNQIIEASSDENLDRATELVIKRRLMEMEFDALPRTVGYTVYPLRRDR